MDREIVGNLGFVYDKQGRLTQAGSAFMVAVTIAPSQTTGWGGLGLVLAKEGRVNDAVAAFHLAYRFSKSPAKTIEYFTKLAESDPDQNVRVAAGKALPFMTSTN